MARGSGGMGCGAGCAGSPKPTHPGPARAGQRHLYPRGKTRRGFSILALSATLNSDNRLHEGVDMNTPLPPGWYPDPDGEAEKLYWDGHQWYAAPPPHAASAPKCFKCNHRQAVAKSTTSWVCDKCGQKLKRAFSPEKPAQSSSRPMGTPRATRQDSPGLTEWSARRWSSREPAEAGDSAGAFGSNIGKNTAVAIGVCVLVAIGLVMSMQSVSLMTGSGPIWTGVGFVAAGTAVAFFMRATTWVRVVAAVCLAVVLFNAFYMEQQLSEMRNEISQIFDN